MTVRGIRSDLRTCLKEGEWDFDILNTYCGVQFLCPAILASVAEDSAIFKVPPSYGAALLETGKQTFVLNHRLQAPLQATVAAYDPVSGKLELIHFASVGDKVGYRRDVRVEPSDLLQTEVKFDGQTLSGSVRDVSMGGMSFHLDHPGNLQGGIKVMVKLYLPVVVIQLPGKLQNIEEAQQGYRAAVAFSADAPQKAILEQYIDQRRTEIQDEVRQRYEAWFQAIKE